MNRDDARRKFNPYGSIRGRIKQEDYEDRQPRREPSWADRPEGACMPGRTARRLTDGPQAIEPRFSFQEIGDAAGISRQAVHDIERRAIEKIAEFLRPRIERGDYEDLGLPAREN